MRNLYEYFYYRSYDLVKLTGNYDLAWGASHFMNAIFAFVFIRFYLYFDFFHSNNIVIHLSYMWFFVSLYGISHLLLMKGKKYFEVIQRFEGETRRHKKLGRALTLGVFILLLFWW